MHDVIVVGARCAGSPLAMLLARRGHRVLVVDQSRFPSDTVSTHLIWQAGLARARAWGLLHRIDALGAPRIRRVSLDFGEIALAGTPPPADGVDYALAPRRTVLDKLLVDAAREAGATVREGFRVLRLSTEGGRVVGIRGHVAGGPETEERARVVVGADGCHSIVAREVGAAKYNERPSTATAYYTYWRGGPPVSSFDTFVRPGFGAAVLPTNDGLACVVAGWVPEFAAGPPEDRYRAVLRSVPQLVDFLLYGEQAEPLRGFREMPGYFRRSAGDGWALAGDAGYSKHPLSAQGITDAFRDADMLADAIHDGLSGRRDLGVALAEYERRRDEAVTPMYESTIGRARMAPPPPHVVALFRALSRNPRETDRFLGTDAGTVPIPEFFAPDNLERIMRAMPPDQGGGTAAARPTEA